MSHLVQSTLGGRGSAALGGFGILTSSAAGFGQNTVAGNLLVIIIYGSGTQGVGNNGATISGGYPQSFFPCLTAARTNGGVTGIAQIRFISNAPSMSPSQTITCAVSNPGATPGSFTVAFDLYEFSGVINPQVVEINAGPGVTGRQFFGSPGTVSSTFTATANMDLILNTLTAPTGVALAAGTGYTLGFNGSLVNSQFQYQCGTAIGQTSVGFTGSESVDWSMSAIAFKSDAADSGGDGGSGGGGGDTGCGACSGPHLLQLISGFSDLPDSVLQAEDPAFALHVGEIATNATFGMVRMEVFPCIQIHGDTVALPTSCLDGYKYSREELNYIWTVQNSTEHSTNWISGPDSLWFSNWNVNQTTGEVFSEEWYERSSSADTRLAAKSNDGLLMVFTIAQRQKTNMIMSAPAVYNSISESTIAIDKPYTQDLVQHLNQNAKFGCVNKEFFYLGEYVNGTTVDLAKAISAVDGYAYAAAECEFIHTWRWTSLGNNYLQPPGNYEQAAPFQASISAAGLVSITVTFSTSGGENVVTAPGYGRIAAFAFCTRSATPGTGTLANAFTELSLDYFAPGRTVRASELLTIKRNIDEAILSPEFFGPTDYADAATVPTPVSAVDGYAYARDEVQYIWSWSKVINNSGGTHVRLPLFFGSVDPDTGKVTLRCWRLPPGGPYVDDSNVNARITVIVMAIRNSIHPVQTITQKINANTPADSGTAPIDNSIIQINGA